MRFPYLKFSHKVRGNPTNFPPIRVYVPFFIKRVNFQEEMINLRGLEIEPMRSAVNGKGYLKGH